MIDAHVHLEKGDYSVEWINKFVGYAVKRNIDEVYFLEHTHIFKECRNLYNPESVKLIVFICQSTIRLAKSKKCTLIMLNQSA